MKLHHTIHSPQHSETVLLLHGLGSCGEDWILQLPALTPHYRVVTLDARGHGGSPKPIQRYTIEEMTEDVIETMDDLKINDFHAVGLSMGGCMALQLAIAHPHRVRTLTSVNSYAKLKLAGIGGVIRFIERMWMLYFGSMEQMGAVIANRLFPKESFEVQRQLAIQRFAANPREVYKKVIPGVALFNALSKVNQVKCPTLIIAGDRDLTVPLAAKQQLHRAIPQSEMIIIPDSGHATPIDQPEEFNKVLVEFLKKNRASQ